MPEETTPKRRRAPAMSQEERRDAIVQATLPLLELHGANVTTSQIARAAGIAEGTVFRAFKDKQELIHACVHEALSPEPVIDLLDRTASLPDLRDRAIWTINALSSYLERMWSLAGVLRESGFDPHDKSGGKPKNPGEHFERLHNKAAAVFEPDADRLAVEPALAAKLLLGLVMANRARPGAPTTGADASPEQLVDLFLHGALRGTRCTTS
ncbi:MULTISPECIES: TetR/AcrR family transcriptional regulator [Actinosynnema]|uniref:TetR family transcriptional regulator n=1 Tax=Actinosynnema pretiosum TaxID=42197 RepID=A0A290Z1A8_9PSEU|nr:TetR/AcrR family transcriptional regulator [Actinosynnema pretiosum]ATE52821.1 TetR family transcriptional regulator [Actinosynnema pretiosum]